MRTPLVVCLACGLAGAPSLAAQESPPSTPEVRADKAVVLVTATAGSFAGAWLWLIRNMESTDPSWATAAAATTLGSAVGGWLGAGADDPFGRFMLGAGAGIAGGLFLGSVADGSGSLGNVMFAYSLGQGIVTTVLGTRSPRGPR